MITIELTEKQIEYLIEQSRQYGRFGLIVPTHDDEFVSLVVNYNHRRDRRRSAAAAAGEGKADA